MKNLKTVEGFFIRRANTFCLYRNATLPRWREPQVAALCALKAHWSLQTGIHPVVALPTGVGKTAVATALPFLVGARRTLVVVPTRELREQIAEQFRTLKVLRTIGALDTPDDVSPNVVEVSSRVTDWSTLLDADVVVGIPASLSPRFYTEPPPQDLFDLVIVDEAHHAPADTWNEILQFFVAKAVLLTATPKRRDGKRIPGQMVYYYPVRLAIKERFFQVVQPTLLDCPANATQPEIDSLIAETIRVLAEEPRHQSSKIIVRADTKLRAKRLTDLYNEIGVKAVLLHSGLPVAAQKEAIRSLKDGDVRAIVMIGMLVEGFDLPSLRIAAYHDKHKSLQPTVQLIGRLARVHPDFPQTLQLVTVKDQDIYPGLFGAVRSLYEEDRDWAELLPGLIDGEIADEELDRTFAHSFSPTPVHLDLSLVRPVCRSVIYEIDRSKGWSPELAKSMLSDELTIGSAIHGHRVLYAGESPTSSTLVVVTGAIGSPDWFDGSALDSAVFDLSVVSHCEAPRADEPDLLLVNAPRYMVKSLLEAIGAKLLPNADPTRVQLAFDSLPRKSLSNVGIRNTNGALEGMPAYRTLAGKSFEGGVRDSDTTMGAIGHAMVQIESGNSKITAGVSTGKAKYWESRHLPLRLYESFASDLADRYWDPPANPLGPLLPQVARGERILSWPNEALLAEMNPGLIGRSYEIAPGKVVGQLDVLAGKQASAVGSITTMSDKLPLALVDSMTNPAKVVWLGFQDLLGQISDQNASLVTSRGSTNSGPLADLLSQYPPTIYFADGTTVVGAELFRRQTYGYGVPEGLLIAQDWSGVDLTSETRKSAVKKQKGISIHEWVENQWAARNKPEEHRWVLCNDGKGEIADHIVIERTPSRVRLHLWHSKFSGASTPAARITDLEEVTAQAIKSRRWVTDPRLWSEIRTRRIGNPNPTMNLVLGNAKTLDIVLGHPASRWPQLEFATRRPIIEGRICIVQPGLSVSALNDALEKGDHFAQQIVQLLQVFRDAVIGTGPQPIVYCSP